MEMLAIPENNTTIDIYNPNEIRNGSLNNKLVFMQKANADVTKSGKQTIITINCRCFDCISNCVQGSISGGRAFESFSDYYIHVCSVMDKNIEIFKCPCKGCPWSIVRSFGAMIKHLRLEHTDLHEEFSTLCDGDFTKLWISADTNKWTAALKFKKTNVVNEIAPIKKEDSIDWENAPVLGTAKEMQSTWTKPPQMKTPEPVVPSADEFPSLVEDSMKQVFIGPLEKSPNIIINGIEYYAARAPWDIKLDDNNKIFTGIMKKDTTFYVGMCPNERPLTFDEKRSPDNNNYCLDKTCSFDHIAGWSESHIEINEPVHTSTEVNDSELEEIFSELTEIKLDATDIQEMPKKQRKRKNNKEDPSAFEDN
jgi:hypothetical protein